MEHEVVEIGLSGLGAGTFPDKDRVASLIRQWRLLPLAGALGYSEEAMTTYMVHFLSLFSGASMSDFANTFRNDILPHWRDGLLTAPGLSELSAGPRVEASEAENSDDRQIPSLSCANAASQAEFAPGMTSRKRSAALKRPTAEEEAVDVLALFTALYAYLASVERVGPDAANSFSLRVHGDVSLCPIEFLLNLPDTLGQLKKKNPGQFTRLLRQYPENTSAAGIFRDATVFIPGEGKTIAFSEFVRGLRSHSITKPERYEVRPAKTPGARKYSDADLHDHGCYLEALLLSLLAGRHDFITKGVNLGIAQDEGLAIMDGRYAELGGQQGVAELLAQDCLDKHSRDIVGATVLDGKSLERTKKSFDNLRSLMARFKRESMADLKEAAALRRLGQVRSLEEEVEDEEGEVSTLAETIQAPADLEEALPQLAKILDKLDPDDVKLFEARFFEGRPLDEIAIERGWEYDRVQKRILRLVEKIRAEMS